MATLIKRIIFQSINKRIAEICCIVGHIVIYYFRDYPVKINNIQFQGVGTSNIADVSYIGEYDADYIYTKVEVIIRNGTIVNIIFLEHKNKRGQMTEKVISDIVDTHAFPVELTLSWEQPILAK